MSSKFKQQEVDELLKNCHRRCCICHRWCGVKIETDHITPTEEHGSSDINNAIPVCFECHAEIHSYNPRHPRGRKFRAEELRMHKEQWLSICSERPEIFVQGTWDSDVGPLQALIDELEFNGTVASYSSLSEYGCPFRDDQFGRAIREGILATVHEDLKNAILDAYVATGRANRRVSHAMALSPTTFGHAEASLQASNSIVEARSKIDKARRALLQLLSSEK